MKVDVEEHNTHKADYPCLMISKVPLEGCLSRQIIYATSGTDSTFEGMQITETDSAVQNYGRYSESWIMDSFEPFTGKITLSN